MGAGAAFTATFWTTGPAAPDGALGAATGEAWAEGSGANPSLLWHTAETATPASER
jgi:hypothetical protein